MTAHPKVIQWRVDDGPWQHGRTVEGWVHGSVLADQRRYTREHVRDTEPLPDGARISTRVVSEREAWGVAPPVEQP